MELSIVIPVYNNKQDLPVLINNIKELLFHRQYDYEIIIAADDSADSGLEAIKEETVRVFIQKIPGYGAALKEAVALARGNYIITIDADFSHNPYLIRRLFQERERAHIVIASRYIKGGLANMPYLRRHLSVFLNKLLAWGLSLEVMDITSGFRLYSRDLFKEISLAENNFGILAEILVKAQMSGFSIKEIPFHYHSRLMSRAHSRAISLGLSFLCAFWKIWKIRNTIVAADYDERAFYSRIPMQKFWQRKKYEIISRMAGYPVSALDVGCGSSKILGALPQAVGLDINFKKLRYNLSLGNFLVNADIKRLPFKDKSFEMVICSEVLEHLPYDERIFKELIRVMKENGFLILATPDYSRVSWLIIEWLYKRIVPGGYGDEHITHYSRKSLVELMRKFGFEPIAHKYILASDLICKFKKGQLS